MSAGKPDYAKLYQMGKLPKEARGNIPMLAQLDKAEARIKELEAEIAKLKGEEVKEEESGKNEGEFKAKCEEPGCEHVALGKSEAWTKNLLRLHMKKHVVK